MQGQENRRRRKLLHRPVFSSYLRFVALLPFHVCTVLYFTRSSQSEHLLRCREGKTFQGNMLRSALAI